MLKPGQIHRKPGRQEGRTQRTPEKLPALPAFLFKVIALDVTHAWSGIERSPDVMGGDTCLVRTRIPVWLLERYRRLGWSEARILENFPVLRAADLVNAWSYSDAHSEEIDQAIREQDTA